MNKTKDKLDNEKAQKAVINLSNKGIDARIDSCENSVYISINDTELEISQFELDFQAQEYDESH